ncbi:PREDICTED: uncharacterized protein LOC109209877 isoform X3 [Nicotiana attenuata]|uniref:uncharacterized protein LOC109209877 isoform X3 n=1 Tax=Nicotiana attenuata TaxID=49451 RepID=UPI0009059522|nr:PREDICTED: uncharacterized protein LOC109209877 isoform X3 [Nicotiana attenuata]
MFRSKLGEINAQLRKEGGLRSILSSSLLWSNHFGLGGVVDSSSLFLWIWYTDKINMDKIESRVADLVKQHDSMYKDFLRKGNIAECEAVKAALLSYPKISVKLATYRALVFYMVEILSAVSSFFFLISEKHKKFQQFLQFYLMVSV